MPRYLVPALSKLCEMKTDTLSRECCFQFEEEIRRSRFITSLGKASTREEALQFIEAVRKAFPDATHNCWAYAAGSPGDTACIGQSDDGEPHGTAGKPMLNLLLFGNIGEIVAVTTRYFGGIKLGTGGLVRAYQSGVAQALKLLPVQQKTVPVFFELETEYSRLNKIKRIFPEFEVCIMEELFTDIVRISVMLPEDSAESFKKALIQATEGAVRISAQKEKKSELA